MPDVIPAAGCDSLDRVREQIDRLDRDIVRLLVERAGYVARAADFKRNDAEVRAPVRAQRVIDNAAGMAAEAGADPALMERIYRELVAAFTDYEISVRNS